QKDLMTFPEDMASIFKGKYFGDDIDQYDRDPFRDKYLTQLKDLKDIVQPVNYKGEGVVQLKSGPDSWDTFLGLQRSFHRPPSKEDMWLAQEDLWVTRELLRVIRDANDSVARFKEVKPGASAPLAKPDPIAEPISFLKNNEDSSKDEETPP